MATMQRVLGTDTGKNALMKLDANCVALNTEIVTLSAKNAPFRVFTDVTQISSGFTVATDIFDVARAMPNNSIAIYDIGGTTHKNYPTTMAIVTITRKNQSRIDLECASSDTGDSVRRWISTIRSEDTAFRGWKQLATTEKTEISLIPATGWTITAQKTVMINNIIYVYGMMKKTDGTNIGTGYNTVATLPYTPTGAYQGSATGVSGAISSGTVDFNVDKNISVVLAKDGVTSVKISGVVVV